MAHISHDSVRTEIAFYQCQASTVTIEEINLTSTEYLKYSISHLSYFLRKAGYRAVTIFVYSQEMKTYEDLGFRQVATIKDLNMSFMTKAINI